MKKAAFLFLVLLAGAGLFYLFYVLPSSMIQETLATPSSPAPTRHPLPTETATATPRATEAPEVVGQIAVIKAATVNVRESPGGAVIGALAAGDVVTVDYCGTDPEEPDYQWCEISEPLSGYVFEGCLSGSDLGCEAK